MNNIDPEILEQIYRKIPELRHGRIIGLSTIYFRNLTDFEFIVLYQMPGLTIRVAPKCMRYIEERRVKLGLNKAYCREEK